MCGICFNPAGERSCCCFPLSLGLLAVAAYFGTTGGIEIWVSLKEDPRMESVFVGGIINAAIGGYICLCVLFGFLRLRILAYFFTMCAFFATFAIALFKLIAFIILWVDWGKGLKDGTRKFEFFMVTSSVCQLLTIGVVFGFANLFWSAACVYRAGGTGCEFKSYKQLEANKSESGSAKKAVDDDAKV